MKKFVVTLDCNGLRRQVKIFADSEQEAKKITQSKNPNCKILDCSEYIKS